MFFLITFVGILSVTDSHHHHHTQKLCQNAQNAQNAQNYVLGGTENGTSGARIKISLTVFVLNFDATDLHIARSRFDFENFPS